MAAESPVGSDADARVGLRKVDRIGWHSEADGCLVVTGRPLAVDALVAEIAGVAIMPCGITTRAEALLESLGKLVRFDAAQITLLDPERQCQPALVRHGFPEQVRQYLDGPAFVGDLELIGLHRARLPVRVRDMPVPEAVPLWIDHLRPAGFGEGVGVPLITSDGRYLGQLAMITESATPVGDATCDLLAVLAPFIAHAVDPMRSVSALASLVSGAVAAVVLTRAGNTVPLPGMPEHRILSPDSPVLDETAACLNAGHAYGAFLAPIDAHRYLKVAFLACPALPPGHLRAVVLLGPTGGLHRLTYRELSVLGMLIAGWTHRRIGAHLRQPRCTVTDILEGVRTRLNAPTRDAAVLRAADQGLYLPPSLTRTAD